MTPRVVVPGAPLTDRERQVLALVAQGCTNAEVGRRIGYSEDTVKHELRNAMRKLDVRDRTTAVLAAIQRGAITPPAGGAWMPSAAVRDVVARWQGKAPAALLAELAGLCGDQPVRRVS